MMFKANLEKTTEVLLYLSFKTLNFKELIILIFKADIIHLNNYGRPVTGLNYIKENGYISIQELNSLIKQASSETTVPFLKIQNSFIPKRPANLDFLSESDKQTLSQENNLDVDKILNNTDEGKFLDLTHFIDNEEVLEYLYENDTLSIVI